MGILMLLLIIGGGCTASRAHRDCDHRLVPINVGVDSTLKQQDDRAAKRRMLSTHPTAAIVQDGHRSAP
jgi:hypothetical protein